MHIALAAMENPALLYVQHTLILCHVTQGADAVLPASGSDRPPPRAAAAAAQRRAEQWRRTRVSEWEATVQSCRCARDLSWQMCVPLAMGAAGAGI